MKKAILLVIAGVVVAGGSYLFWPASLEMKLNHARTDGKKQYALAELLPAGWEKACIIALGGNLYYHTARDSRLLREHFETLLFSPSLADEAQENEKVYLLAAGGGKLLFKESVGRYGTGGSWREVVGKHGMVHVCTEDKNAVIQSTDAKNWTADWEEKYTIGISEDGEALIRRNT